MISPNRIDLKTTYQEEFDENTAQNTNSRRRRLQCYRNREEFRESLRRRENSHSSISHDEGDSSSSESDSPAKVTYASNEPFLPKALSPRSYVSYRRQRRIREMQHSDIFNWQQPPAAGPAAARSSTRRKTRKQEVAAVESGSENEESSEDEGFPSSPPSGINSSSQGNSIPRLDLQVTPSPRSKKLTAHTSSRKRLKQESDLKHFAETACQTHESLINSLKNLVSIGVQVNMTTSSSSHQTRTNSFKGRGRNNLLTRGEGSQRGGDRTDCYFSPHHHHDISPVIHPATLRTRSEERKRAVTWEGEKRPPFAAYGRANNADSIGTRRSFNVNASDNKRRSFRDRDRSKSVHFMAATQSSIQKHNRKFIQDFCSGGQPLAYKLPRSEYETAYSTTPLKKRNR